MSSARWFAVLGLAARWLAALGLACAGGCTERSCEWAAPVEHALETEADLFAIDGSVVVGDGVIVSASTTLEIPSVTLRALARCAASSGCVDYAVGDGGVAYVDLGDDQGWAPVDLGVERDLRDVAVVDDQVIVVGDEVLRVFNAYEGPAVAFDPVPPTPAGWGLLYDYAGHAVVGEGGAIYVSEDLHTWSVVASGTSEDLLALGFVDRDPGDAQPAELWAVGRAGVVLARRGQLWERLDYGLDVDLLDFDAGFVITADARVLRLLDEGEVEAVAKLDRQPHALEAGFFGAAESSIEVVGERGLYVTIARCDGAS